MNIKEYIRKLIKTCNEHKITDVEVYYSSSSSTVINVVNDEVENFKLSNNEGINISGNYEGKNSVTYIEKFDDDSMILAVNNIKETAPYNNKVRKTVEKNNLDNKSDASNNADIDHKADINHVIEKLKTISKKSKTFSEKIIAVPRCEYYENRTKIILFDDRCAELEDFYSYSLGSIGLVAQEGEIKKNAYSSRIGKCFEEVDYDSILKDAADEAISMINAKPIKSGNYDVIIKNSTAANIFASFMPVFYADAIKKNTSKLKGKTDTQVAVNNLNIIEDPLYPKAKIKRNFDDEGIKTYKKPLIENGTLRNILSSSEYENSTGNAYRDSYRSNIAVSAMNCYIEPGVKQTSEMILGLKEGVMITNVDGLHAGINTTTGDFSLIANGYYIENGEIKKPVNQITVAGNFYEMLNNIIDISEDVLTSDNYINYFESPSLLVKGLMIGGL